MDYPCVGSISVEVMDAGVLISVNLVVVGCGQLLSLVVCLLLSRIALLPQLAACHHVSPEQGCDVRHPSMVSQIQHIVSSPRTEMQASIIPGQAPCPPTQGHPFHLSFATSAQLQT